ncbi:MAG: DUF4249 family protein [Candidatus Eisenbacteria bacterium]|nr:DUF4249 family protein [Candidatus Eisenbacteria bacterium]
MNAKYLGKILRRGGIAAALPFLLAAGCGGDDLAEPDTAEEIVVFAYLYVNEAVADSNAVYVGRNQDLLDVYDDGEAAVPDATVLLLEEGAAEADTLWQVSPGRYNAPGVIVKPLTRYQLRVEIPGRATITAATVTPAPFEVVDGPLVFPDEMKHDEVGDKYPITFTCGDPRQIFLVDVYCLEHWEDAEYVEAFGTDDYPNDYDEYGGDAGEPRHIAPFFRIEDLEGKNGDLYEIGWYGDMMVFYGRYDVNIYSIDDNYYNYLYREHPERSGGIDGGIGVFGSACRAGWTVKVVK